MTAALFDTRSKKSKISNLLKIRPVGAEFHTDGQTDGWTDNI
jgi:hypothetical protein